MSSLRTSGRTPREARREQMSARLHGAVERLLGAGHAYSDLSVDRLVAEAGVSRSGFYRQFADKGELLQHLADDVDQQRVDKGLAIWRLPGSASRAAFDAAVREFVDVCWRHRVLMGTVLSAATYDATIRDEHQRKVQAALDVITGHIQTGQAQGRVRPELDAGPVAAWLVHMAERGQPAVIGAAAEEDLPQVARALADLLWATVYGGLRDAGGPA